MCRSAVEVLQQAEGLLGALDDAAYTTRVPVAFNATIGGHVRHCLDHFRTLLGALECADLDYDRRERGTLVEQDRFAALNEVRSLREAYERLPEASLERVLTVTCKTSYVAPGSQTGLSTLGRELMYCVAHAVHHHALIGVMAGLLQLQLPAGFGVAPSTVQHQQQRPKPAAAHA